MLNCCPVCYQVADGNLFRDSVKNGNGTVEGRFFQSFQRYLNKRVDITKLKDDSDVNQLSSHILLKQLREMGMFSCSGCLKAMTSFCDLYEQFKRLELQLDWKVEQIKNLMEGESTLIKYVVESIDQLEVQEEYKKGVTKTIQILEKSKKALIAKCSRKLKNSLPRVSISKSTGNEVKKCCGKRKREPFQSAPNGKSAKRGRRTNDDNDGGKPSVHSGISVTIDLVELNGDEGPPSLNRKVREPKIQTDLSCADKPDDKNSEMTKPSKLKPKSSTNIIKSKVQDADSSIICSPILQNELTSNESDRNSSTTTTALLNEELIPTNDMVPIQEEEVKSSSGQQKKTVAVDVIDLTIMTLENTRNSENGGYTCSLCTNSVGFCDEKEVQEHYISTHPGLRYECPDPECKMELGNPLSVYKHYWRVHREIRFECGECNQIFEDGFELLKHKQGKMSCVKKISSISIPEEAGSVMKIKVIQSRR